MSQNGQMDWVVVLPLFSEALWSLIKPLIEANRYPLPQCYLLLQPLHQAQHLQIRAGLLWPWAMPSEEFCQLLSPAPLDRDDVGWAEAVAALALGLALLWLSDRLWSSSTNAPRVFFIPQCLKTFCCHNLSPGNPINSCFHELRPSSVRFMV